MSVVPELSECFDGTCADSDAAAGADLFAGEVGVVGRAVQPVIELVDAGGFG
jgi:hypothetical protein